MACYTVNLYLYLSFLLLPLFPLVTKITRRSCVFCYHLHFYCCAVYLLYHWLPFLPWFAKVTNTSVVTFAITFVKVSDVHFLLWLIEGPQFFRSADILLILLHSFLVKKKRRAKPVHTTVVMSRKTFNKTAIMFVYSTIIFINSLAFGK